MERLKGIEDLKALRERLSLEFEAREKPLIRVCCGTGCTAAGGPEVAEAFSREIERQGLDVELVTTGCQGWCEKGPLVTIEPPLVAVESQNLFYQRVNPFDVSQILDLTVSRGRPIERLLYAGPQGEIVPWRDDVPFYKKQRRIILRNCGRIAPTSIHDSIGAGGYDALAKVLSTMTPEEVIDVVKGSQLRGRGGAGFPTGLKWEICRAEPETPKYLICNGDEGDPGAFMDRTVLEGDPHSVLEGMIIGAYAVGDISEAFIYVRGEYPLAVRNLTIALAQAAELGLVGENILGSGFDLTIEIKKGAGAFVCGESSALMYSIEGRRGMPRQKPPRSTEAGLWDKPTVLNNVKTFATVPVIINRGADWYAGIGTERSKGTQVFALTGKIKNTGLIELPMGTTIREIVYDIGEGVLDDKECKAVQIGGPSGGCVPVELFDTPIDFDSLTSAGAMMGSGGLVVMDESDCMVEIARFFLAFTQQESCGKCPPCRLGTYQMLRTLDRIVEGEGRPGDIEFLETLAEEIQATSLCALGRTAPNPVLTTIRHFREEYEAHIYDKYCPAKVCKALGDYRIVEEECLLCGLCKDVCEDQAVIEGRNRFFIDPEECERCGKCLAVCPSGAVVFERTKVVA
jgi:NADH:ubiquinone oxidoreductase subunit F (NADH-binding)/(2Fe-2S) ferredoxin